MKVSVGSELAALQEAIEKRLRRSRLADSVSVGVAKGTEVYADYNQTIHILLSQGSVGRQIGTRKNHGGALEELDVILERLTGLPRWPIRANEIDPELGKSLKALRQSYQDGSYEFILSRLVELSGANVSEQYIQHLRTQRTRLEKLWGRSSDQWDRSKWADYLQTVIEPLDMIHFIHRGWYVHATPLALDIAEVTACDVVRNHKGPYWRVEISNPTDEYLQNKVAFATSNLIVLHPEGRDKFLGDPDTQMDRRSLIDYSILKEEETHLHDRRLSHALQEHVDPSNPSYPLNLAINIFGLGTNPTTVRRAIVSELLQILESGTISTDDFGRILFEAHAEFEKLLNAYSPDALRWIFHRLSSQMTLSDEPYYQISSKVVFIAMARCVSQMFVNRGYPIENAASFFGDGNFQRLWDAMRKRPWIAPYAHTTGQAA
jgi:hypothetical protein